MIGIIPAAGAGLRIQPLGCSKELLPVGSREISGVERPKAVSEYLVERMIAAGAKQICMVISAEKSDIVRYYAERDYAAEIFYVVQQRPQGLCDESGQVERVVVKEPNPGTNWIWGAVTASGRAFQDLRLLWEARHRKDEYLGHLLNAYIAAGNPVHAIANGEHYMDVGTMEGYHNAQDFLRARSRQSAGHNPAEQKLSAA